jgi:hypothetical protein
MNVVPLYTYHLSGRRSGMVFALVFSVAMMAFAARYAAPWYFLIPVGLAAAMALWAIIANPQTGSILTAETLHLFNRSSKDVVHIADIASMKVTNWSDGPDTVTLTLRSGRVVYVPSLCADSKLAIALRGLGVSDVG